jgi:hypothetical protein
MHTVLRALAASSALLTLSACGRNSLKSFEGHISMHTTLAKGEAHDMTVEAKGDKLRFDMTGRGGAPTHAVYDPATPTQMLVFIDTEKKYMNLDFSAPSAQPNTNPATSTITKAGTHKSIAGVDCEQWSVKDGTGHHSDVCIAQGIAFFDPSRVRPGASREPETALAKEFREHKSFPLESIEYDTDGKELTRMEVVKIEKSKVADSEYGVPDGYTKVELPNRPR